jgi:NUMOD3 motif
MGQFYSYLWLREDGSPYYVGKGSGRRAFRDNHGVHRPANKTRIILFLQEDEASAFQSEKDLIALFGRKDNGTGILRNLTDGGEGSANPSIETRQRLSQSHQGKPSPKKGKKISDEARQNLKGFSKGHVPWNAQRRGGSWSSLRRQAFERQGMSESTRQKMREAKLGKVNLKSQGLKRSEETKQKMRKPRSYRWTLSAETKEKMQIAAVLREKKKRESKWQTSILCPM